MANYHFKLKTDKKKDGTRVRATNHVTYINREGKYKDIDERGIGSLAYADTLTGVRHIEHLPNNQTRQDRHPYLEECFRRNGGHCPVCGKKCLR